MRPDTDCANKKRKLPSMREKFSRIGSFSLWSCYDHGGFSIDAFPIDVIIVHFSGSFLGTMQSWRKGKRSEGGRSGKQSDLSNLCETLLYNLAWLLLPSIKENAEGTVVVQSFVTSRPCRSNIARQSLTFSLQKSVLKFLILLLLVSSVTDFTSVQRVSSSSRFKTCGKKTIRSFPQ